MRGLKKPFKAPRQVRKQKEQARLSESEDDDIPFSELKEKVIAERQGSFIEKEKPSQVEDKMIRLFTAREAKEVTMFGELLTLSDDEDRTEVSMAHLAESLQATPLTSAKSPPVSEDDEVPIVKSILEAQRQTYFVGTKVARDFGKTGIFIGEVVEVEYDSDDVGREAPFYVVQYTDGDREDMDEDEFTFAHEYFGTLDDSELQKLYDKQDVEVALSSSSGEEESYRPAKKVSLLFTFSKQQYALQLPPLASQGYGDGPNCCQGGLSYHRRRRIR
jgi:hypothetical protein